MVSTNHVDTRALVQQVIDRHKLSNVRDLITVQGGHDWGKLKVEFTISTYNEHTEALVKSLTEVLEGVYGKRPQITVYVPYKPKESNEPNNPTQGQ